MAGGQERILRRRIRSVQSTKKITRAMELIAASRIVHAQARVAAAVPYSDQITEVVHDLADAGGAIESPYLVPRPEVRRIGHIVLTADRGLCGAYNSSVLRAAEGEIEEHRELGARLVGVRGRTQGRELLPLPAVSGGGVVHGLQRTADVRGRPSHRRRRARPVPRGAHRHGASHLHPLHHGGKPGGRGPPPDAPGARDRSRRGRARSESPRGRARRTSSSPARGRSWNGSCRGTSRRASSPRCSTRRRPSRPPASGR